MEKLIKIVLLLFLLLQWVACSQMVSRSDEGLAFDALRTGDPAPKHVAVLPFGNQTPHGGLAADVRKSFYNHFSSKNYYDIELSSVDSAVSLLEETLSRSWSELSHRELGTWLGADFLVMGEVLNYKTYFFGIYSQRALEVEIRMIETRQGRVAWQERFVKRMHSGDVPLSVLALFSASIRSALNLQQEKKEMLIDTVCRKLVENIPEQPAAAVSGVWFELQVGAFSRAAGANAVKDNLEKAGLPVRIEKTQLQVGELYRVLVGPYRYGAASRKKQWLLQQFSFKSVLVRKSAGVQKR
ncbi:MAG: hypothetical protein GY868_01145 [Deltaproteobacteria bacterium]|nr:hypothetical protein [Deltaproteobacteria bacterium]